MRMHQLGLSLVLYSVYHIGASKTLVGPLSSTSILRLNVMGAVLGISLFTFWNDNIDVLWQT